MGKSRLNAPRPFSRRAVRQGKPVTGLKLNGPGRRGPNHEIRISPCRCIASPSSLRLALRRRHPGPDRATLRGTLVGGDQPRRHRALPIVAHHNPGLVRGSAARCRSGPAMSLLRDKRSSVRRRAGHLPGADVACVAA
jgi:hypothetical protein